MSAIKVIAIIGSTRVNSTNLSLVKAIQGLKPGWDLEIFRSIDKIPHFNPDLDHEHPPQEVSDFRNKLKQADGILISTPEYAMGVPGSLKNAIDWTVSSCEFSGKPVALITGSSSGLKGHQALLETLYVIESNITDKTSLVISYIKTKVDSAGEITDSTTKDQVAQVLNELERLMGKAPDAR